MIYRNSIILSEIHSCLHVTLAKLHTEPNWTILVDFDQVTKYISTKKSVSHQCVTFVRTAILVFMPFLSLLCKVRRNIKAECSLGWAFFETSKFLERGEEDKMISLFSSSRMALLHSVPVFVYLGVSINPFRASLRIYKVHEPAIVMPNKNLLDIGSSGSRIM